MKLNSHGRFIISHFLWFFLFLFTAYAAHGRDPKAVSPQINASPILGNVNAPVKIVEFTDFECHFCGQVQPALRQALKAHPNEVSLVFKNFPLSFHHHAHAAHLAAMCANDQGKFWDYRNVLFGHQSALKRTDLLDYARQLNLNLDTFTQCLDQEKYASKIEEDLKEGVQSGVLGTPTFFINGRILSGAQPLAAFEQMIQQALAERSKQD